MDLTHIIIATYNAKPWLSLCLGSIDFNHYQVIVVDNNSKDGTLRYIKSNYPDVVLLEQDKNLGFGQANNLGISHALMHGAEHVFLINQDAYLVDDVLEKLIDFQSKNNEYGILSPIHINADKTKLDRGFSNYLRYDKNPYFFSDHVLGDSLKKVYDVPFVNAAGWLISRKCLMSVGGFDPIFHHYGEDDNYCQRLLYHGFKIGVLPNSYIIHDREDRAKSNFKLYSEAYYNLELRNFKVKYANVNEYDELSIIKYKNRIRKQLLKAFLKRDKQKIKNLKTYLKLLDKTIPELENSVKSNRKVQPNYLVMG